MSRIITSLYKIVRVDRRVMIFEALKIFKKKDFVNIKIFFFHVMLRVLPTLYRILHKAVQSNDS